MAHEKGHSLVRRRVGRRDGAAASGRVVGVLEPLGARISRDTLVIVLGTTAALPAGLITTVVYTHHIDPALFGALAILMSLSSFLTILYNVGIMHGTFLWVYGSAGEEVDLAAEEIGDARERRRVLGTGLVMEIMAITLATTALVIWRRELSQLLLGTPRRGYLVELALISGGVGSVFRFTSNTLRLDRRVTMFSLVMLSRPVFVLSISIPLVVGGQAVAGAVAGIVYGTLASIALSLVVTWRSYVFRPHWTDCKRILAAGARFTPVVVGLWIAHSGDVYLLSRFTSHYEVGLYRLAGRIAAVPSYFVSAFLMVWAPLERSGLFAAAYRQRSRALVRSELLTYYVLASLSIVLFLAVAADLLVQIAAPSYRGAADLLPILGMGFAAYGLFVVFIRIASIRNKHVWYGILSMVCAGSLVLSIALLAPAFGAWGAGASNTIAMSVGSVGAVIVMRRHEDPVRIEWRKLVGGLAVATSCYLLAIEPRHLIGGFSPVLDLMVLIVYPVLLVALGIVPRRRVRRLGKMMVDAVYPYREVPLRPLARLAEVDQAARRTFVVVFRDHMSVEQAASAEGIAVPVAHVRIVRALRRLGGMGRPQPTDARLGEFLASEFTTLLAKDSAAGVLWDEGVDPLVMERLTQLADRCRRQSARAWRLSERCLQDGLPPVWQTRYRFGN